MSRMILGLTVIALVAVFAGTRPGSVPALVHAASPPPFIFTGGEQTWPVPAGVTRVAIEVRGARGANGCNGIIGGGNGGEIFGIIPVTPGTTLYIEVGGNGVPGTATAGGAGGFNGGGAGGTNGNNGIQLQGGGGGGGTDVRTIKSTDPGSLASRLIAAGGGGGGGGCGNAAPSGPGASGGIAPALGDAKGLDGGGGSPGVGGASGAFGGAGGAAPLGQPGAPGASGIGGAGGNSTAGPTPGGTGGGGGGGAFGGGGGGGQDNDRSGAGGGGGGAGSNQIFAAGGLPITGGVLATTGARIIVLDPPTIQKSFTPGAVALNGLTNLTITLTNPNAAGAFSTLTNVSFTDDFTGQGLVITTGGVTGSPACGGVITANAGSSVISATGITLLAGASCQITVEVRATQPGTQVNTTGAVSAAESGAGGTGIATLQVANTVPSIAKVFNPTSVVVGNTSTMTLTLTNPNIVPMTNVAFSDNFAPLGLVITGTTAGTPPCSGTVTAAIGTSLVSLASGTLAASSSCQIVVTVRANTAGTQTNVTSTLTSTEFAPAPAATAQLVVTAVATPTPTVTPTVTPTLVPVVIPVVPQVFQHVPQGIFTNPRPSTPTPVRQAVAPIVVVDPAAPVVLRPPSTGDAGIMKALKLPSAW